MCVCLCVCVCFVVVICCLVHDVDTVFLLSEPLKYSHGNLAYVMIMLFINIELLMIDNYLSRGYPGQLHEALCKCIGMIFGLKGIYKSGSVGRARRF